jgi:putative polyhydroxyalkanoate system protein
MANLHIRRDHSLGLKAARKIAFAWAEQVESDFGMECTYEEGAAEDTVRFTRSGVNGTLLVTADHFNLDAKLG